MIRSWLKRLYRYKCDNNSKVQLRDLGAVFSPAAQAQSPTIEALDLGAARRQANIGKHYMRQGNTTAQVTRLKQGTLTLPPHPSWTGNYTDWTADPFSDLNWRFQFHTLRWINPYLWDALDGNDASRSEWKRIVRSWTESNTPPERAKDKYAWMDMTDGNRAIQLSIGAPLMDTEDSWFVRCLVTHRDWLIDERNITPGNHGLHQNLGLFVVSSVLADRNSAQLAVIRLGKQLLQAFDAEGLNAEGSIAYHQFNLIWWLEAQKRLHLEGFALPEEAELRLEKAGETMAHLLLPDKTLAQIGDGGRGSARRGLHPLVDRVIAGELYDLELPLLKHFPNGITIFRSGWGQERPLSQESHTIIRHGVDLQRHSHNDRGSVHIYAQGRRWVTDGGFHSYQRRSVDREYTKSREAHSLINLPEDDYKIEGDVPVELLECHTNLHAIEIKDENFESAEWRRRVIYLPILDCWIIWDRVQSDRVQTIHQQWLIDIGIEVSQHDNSSLRLSDNERQLQMHWYGDEPQFDVAPGDHQSSSKRGLIGIGWKKMKNGTSVHAGFSKDEADSIVVISRDLGDSLEVTLNRRSRMSSFQLQLTYGHTSYLLTAQHHNTRLTEGTH